MHLPRLFPSSAGTSTEDDALLVLDVVEKYLKHPRNIILAVVSAKEEVSSQIVLELARKYDPKGKCTLGIITKQDTIPATNSKAGEDIMTLASNESVPLTLGWHVVQTFDSNNPEGLVDSRSGDEISFWETGIFSRLTSTTRGIQALRTRLSRAVSDHMRAQIPQILKERELTGLGIELEIMGSLCTSVEQQRALLVEIARSFHSICGYAVRGNYEHTFFHNSEVERRLYSEIMNKHYAFAKSLRDNGLMWKLVEATKEGDLFNYRTRKQAIIDGAALQKRSRGQEVYSFPTLPQPTDKY